MKTIINIVTIIAMGFGFNIPSENMKVESNQSIRQDLVEKEWPNYKYETEKLKNEPLQAKEVKEPVQTIQISDEEKKLLARLVHAEAKGEPYAGKVAVAEVVLNRVEDEQFPDTVKDVIYEKNAFEPVQNDSIQKPADTEAELAVNEALKEQPNETDALYFYNPETASDNWIRSRQVVKKIGNHAFAM